MNTENILDLRARTDKRIEEADLAKQISRYPYFHTVESASDTVIKIEGKNFLNFGSNNYLGLTTEPQIIEASQKALSTWGTGVTGSRLLNGTLSLHEELEHTLAEYYGKEAALVFPTGYTANLGLLSGLLKRNDTVVFDADIHASLLDGVFLSHAKFKRFKHNDLADFERLLMRLDEKPVMCIIEGIYSMLGDSADVKGFSEVCKRHGITLVVDEAHGLGVAGATGKGVSELDGVVKDVDIFTVTFSKSLASCGGAIIGSKNIINYLRINTRPFLFTAGNTPSSVAAALESLRVLIDKPHMIEELHKKKDFFYEELIKCGLPINKNNSGILTIKVGSDFRVIQAWKMLWNRGVFCNPVVTPAVAHNEGVLRFSVIRNHSYEQLQTAAEICKTILPLLEPSLAL